jgi:hypothetical protein
MESFCKTTVDSNNSVLALATWGNATQIGLIPFVLHRPFSQGKYTVVTLVSDISKNLPMQMSPNKVAMVPTDLSTKICNFVAPIT